MEENRLEAQPDGLPRIVSDRKLSAVEIAVHAILERIRTGEYVGGQRLVEADLAEELGLRRGPIREALRVLTGDGVVELSPNKGARVKRLDPGHLVEILQLLTALNWMSLRLCATRHTIDSVRTLVEAAWTRLQEAVRLHDEADWFIAIGRFHEDLHEASGNSLLLREYRRLRHVHFHRELTRSLRVRNWDGYVDTYRRITHAVLDGDADTAADLIATHEERLVSLIRSGASPAYY